MSNKAACHSSFVCRRARRCACPALPVVALVTVSLSTAIWTTVARADCYDAKAQALVQATVEKLQAAYSLLPESVRRVRNAGGRIVVTVASGNRTVALESSEHLSPAELAWIGDKERRLKIAISNTSVFQLLNVSPDQQGTISSVLKAVYRFNKDEITPRDRVGRLEHIEQVHAIMFWFYSVSEDGRSINLDLNTVFLDGHLEFPTRERCRDQLTFGKQRRVLRFDKNRSEIGVRGLISATNLSTRDIAFDASIRGVEGLGQIYFNDRQRFALDLGYLVSEADTLGALADYKEASLRFDFDRRIAYVVNLGAGLDLRYRFDVTREGAAVAGIEGVDIGVPIRAGLMLGEFQSLFVLGNAVMIPRAFVATGPESVQSRDTEALDWGSQAEFGFRTALLDVTGTVSSTSAVKIETDDDDFERLSARLTVGIGSRTTKLQVGAFYDKTEFRPHLGGAFEQETRAVVLGIVYRSYRNAEGYGNESSTWLQ